MGISFSEFEEWYGGGDTVERLEESRRESVEELLALIDPEEESLLARLDWREWSALVRLYNKYRRGKDVLTRRDLPKRSAVVNTLLLSGALEESGGRFGLTPLATELLGKLKSHYRGRDYTTQVHFALGSASLMREPLDKFIRRMAGEPDEGESVGGVN